MKTVIVSTLKANRIALLREAQRTAEPIIVTRRGRPRIKGDIVHADFAADWEAGS